MQSENLDMGDLTEARRKSIAETIRSISPEQLKELGSELFPYFDHPWRERCYTFIEENAGATFYHATTHDNVHIVYCHAKNVGMWFLRGTGMGALQAKGLGMLKQIVESPK